MHVLILGTLLDADYTTDDGEPTIRLYVANGEERKIAHVHGFKPYFYVVPDGDEDLERLASMLRFKAKRVLVEMPRDPLTGKALGYEYAPSPVVVEEVQRKINAQNVTVLKVTCRHPRHTRKLRDAYKFMSGVYEVREADIPYPMRFLIDNDLRPLNLVATDGEGKWWDAGEADLSNLRFLAYDLEVVSERGFPQPSRDPITVIAWATNTRVPFPHGLGDRTSDTLVKYDAGDDAEIIGAFARLVRDYDPDVILTYNGDGFDWPYLDARSHHVGVPLDLGREGSPVFIDEYAQSTIAKARGRALVDLYTMAERDILDLRDADGKAMARKTLKNVAEALGVMDRSEREMIEGDKLAEAWVADRERVLRYAIDDVVATLGLGDKMLPAQYELCRLTRLPLSQAYRAPRGQQVEWFLTDIAYREGEVVPNKKGGPKSDDEDDEKYAGAFVFPPEAGLHEDVQIVDFEALYPSIMIERNIGPDSYVPPQHVATLEGEGIPVWTSPAGHSFVQDEDSFFKKILVDLKKRRIATKQAKKMAEEGSPEWSKADNADKAFKALINSFYGYTGWKRSRWYFEPCAVSVTLEGQRAIKRVAELAEELGMRVIAGDTDSVFLVNHEGKIDTLIERVHAEMPLKLDRDNHYSVMFFTGMKKRYCGLRYKNGTAIVDAKGLETRRTDWCDLAKSVQWDVIHTVLEEKDPEKAMRRAREVVQRVKAGNVRTEEIVVWKRLNKDPSAYKAKATHVEAVKRALAARPDMTFPIGDKVGFVIVQGDKGMGVTDCSIVIDAWNPRTHPLDWKYYVNKQIMPAALRIIAYFGFVEDDLLSRPVQKPLDGWF